MFKQLVLFPTLHLVIHFDSRLEEVGQEAPDHHALVPVEAPEQLLSHSNCILSSIKESSPAQK